MRSRDGPAGGEKVTTAVAHPDVFEIIRWCPHNSCTIRKKGAVERIMEKIIEASRVLPILCGTDGGCARIPDVDRSLEALFRAHNGAEGCATHHDGDPWCFRGLSLERNASTQGSSLSTVSDGRSCKTSLRESGTFFRNAFRVRSSCTALGPGALHTCWACMVRGGAVCPSRQWASSQTSACSR